MTKRWKTTAKETWEQQNRHKFYNQGNALAQSGQLEQAIKAYEKALTLNPDDDDAKYNKELVEKELEKQKQEQQQQDNKQDNKQEQKQQTISPNRILSREKTATNQKNRKHPNKN